METCFYQFLALILFYRTKTLEKSLFQSLAIFFTNLIKFVIFTFVGQNFFIIYSHILCTYTGEYVLSSRR